MTDEPGLKIHSDGTAAGGITVLSEGRYFDFRDPKADQIFLADIALALSNKCRFNGHCKFYSVAEHSVRCAALAEHYGFPQYIQFHALMHDAAEAYVGDMIKPLKVMMPEFQAKEQEILVVLNKAFNIDTSQEAIVKRFDLEMLKAEKKILFPTDSTEWSGFDKINDIEIDISCWEPELAKRNFLYTFGRIALSENRHQ